MKEILIVNLTRMGDLVQTTPAMAGLKERHPEARITLLVVPEFAGICGDIPFADRVVAFDRTALRKMLRGGDRSLVECYRTLEAFLDGVNETAYDLLLNFTHSGDSAILGSLIDAREVRGITADAEGNRVIRNPWQRYFFNVVPSRNLNPFHLCDMYAKAGGAPPARKGLHLRVSEEAIAGAASILRDHGVAEGDLLVGLQLGASHPVKTWPVRSFARLADRLSKSPGARVLLTGSGTEEGLGQEFERLATSSPVNLIGKTDVAQAAALLARCDLLVSNDTGPLHIAAAVGTTVLDLSLGHVCFRETGPYGEGHYVVEADIPCVPCGFHVECGEPDCKERVSVDVVHELAGRLIRDGSVNGVDDVPFWDGVRVFRSTFAEDGLADYVPLIRRPLDKDTFYTYLYRRTWPRILDGNAGFDAGDECARLARTVADRHLPGDLRRVAGSLDDDLAALARMESLAGKALEKVAEIARDAGKSRPDVERIRSAWKDVPTLDRELEIIGRTHPALMPPVNHFRFGREALEGDDLAALAKASRDLYADLKNHVSMLIGMIEGARDFRVNGDPEPCNT